MAKFTSTADLKIRWNGLDIVGAAGATHRIPDAYLDEFLDSFSSKVPGLTWITQDELSSIASFPGLPIAQSDVSGLVAALAAKVATAGGSVTGTLNVADLQSKGGQWVDVKAFGATGDGTTDDTAAIVAAIAAAPAAGVIYFPPTSAAYVVTAAVTVAKALTLQGGTLQQNTASTAAIDVKASDVTIRSMKIVRGSTPTVDQNGSIGIRIVAPAASTPYRRVRVEGCEIANFNRYGIYAEHLVGFDIRGNYIHDLWYAGVMLLSSQQGAIANNVITDIEGNISSNAYGISVSRNETSSLSAEPRSSDITIVGNVINNIAVWEGIDTHGGERLTIQGNSIFGCPTGIAAVPSDVPTDVETYAPLAVAIIGNAIVWGGGAGSASYGINFAGAGSAAGAVVQYGTGSIVGNTIIGHGQDDSGSMNGGIRFRATRGMAVTGNCIIEPANHGVVVQFENVGFAVTGNQIIDPYSAGHTTNVSGVGTRGSANEGLIAGNSVVRGSKSATTVLNFGIRLQSDTASSIVHIGTNYLDDATTRISDGAADGRKRVEASKIGFFDATPITKPIVTGSRSSGAALTDLLAELALLGLITNSSSA